MCLLCQEQDFYEMYLEQLDRARATMRADAPLAAPSAGWLWPNFVRPAAAGEMSPSDDATRAPVRSSPRSPAAVFTPPAASFVCEEPAAE